MKSSSGSLKRKRAVESFKTAAECIGPIEKDMSVFAITRGQFSMIDAIMHVIDCVGVVRVSVWTWVIADYELQQFERLRDDGRVTDALLVCDRMSKKRDESIIKNWRSRFGADSVRYVMNHAKIATVESDKYRVLLRGSMNLNHNPRFEQLDVTEGGPDFDLVKRIELELPVLDDDCSRSEIVAASRVDEAFDKNSLSVFTGVKLWKI